MSVKLSFLKELSFLKKFGIFILLLVIILFPFFTHMAQASPSVTIDNTSSGTSFISGNISWNHTTNNNQNGILLVGLNVFQGTASSVKYGNQSLTREASISCDQCTTELWYLISPPVGTQKITVASNGNFIMAGAATYYNVDQLTPFGSLVKKSGLSPFFGSANISITATTSQLIFETTGAEGNTFGLSPGSGQTQRWRAAFDPQIESVASDKPGTGASTTMTEGSLQGYWAIIAVALNSVPVPTDTPIPTPTPTPTAASNYINGTVFIDTHGGPSIKYTDPNSMYTVKDTNGNIVDSGTFSGTYNTNKLPAGQYTVIYTVPSGYIVTYPTNTPPSHLVTIGPNCDTGSGWLTSCDANGNIISANFLVEQSTGTPTPSPTPTPSTYTISGNVFNDANKDKLRDNGEQNYPGTIDITSTGGTVSTSNGSFTISGLSAGSYTVSYNNLPTGYSLIYPQGSPPSFLATVGLGCSVDTTTGATCTAGNITNLNFAITNSVPWMQLTNLDTRVDNGFTSKVPQSPNPQCGGYAISQNTSANTPGIVFTGDTSADFGAGQASSANWTVGGSTYPEVFTTTATPMRTSYQYLLTLATKNGVPITDLSTLPTCRSLNNCTLPANFPDGIYQANGDLTLNAYTFPSGKNYVFLIGGDLTILGNIITPNGSTALFSASGNISIDKGVKAATDSCPPPSGQLQGMFIADKNFTIEGNNDCATGQDYMLNIEGAIVVNAARGGGAFQNQRDLCGDNPSYPAVTIKARPDFFLNAPTFLMQQSTISHEEAP